MIRIPLTSMGNLAETLRAMGDYQGAKALQENVVERRKEVLGPDHPDTLHQPEQPGVNLTSDGRSSRRQGPA